MNRSKVTSVLIIILFIFTLSECSKDENVTEPINGAGDWKYGTENTYTAPAIPDGTIYDQASGVTLRFPIGGIGSVSITKVLEAPVPLATGQCVKIEYAGFEPVNIDIDTSGGTFASVLGYGYLSGCFDDEFGNGERWVALPDEETNSSTKSFELVFPTVLGKTANQKVGYDHYWIEKVTATSTLVDQRVYTSLQVNSYVDQLMNTLPSSLKTTVSARETSTHRYTINSDGNYYSGFWWRSLGSFGRLIKPTIHLKLPSNASTIAHETSHYFTHILTNDNFQSELEGQASLFSGHGIRDEVGRNVILEEYAYFGEYLLTGAGGNYDLEEPYVMFKSLSALNVDLPSIEGFGAVLLAQLVRTKSQIRDLVTGNNVDVPVVGMSYGEAFEIISKAAPGIEQLRKNIETKLGADNNKLDGILQRIGWRYSIKGILVDENNIPIQGALFSNILKIDNIEYKGGFTSLPSASDGSFSITGDVFPGKSILQVTLGSDTVDVAITVDYSNKTNQSVDIGTISMEGLLAKIKRTTKVMAHIYAGLPHTWSWYRSDNGESGQWVNSSYNWELTGGYQYQTSDPQLTWTGNSFSYHYTGTHKEDLFSFHTWSNPGEATWIKDFSGTVDKSGKLLNANFKVTRIATSNGEFQEVELVLNNIEPRYITLKDNSVVIAWYLTKDDVQNHLQIIKGEIIGSIRTDTYISTDWQNGIDPYWRTPMEDVFYFEIIP